MVGGGLSEVVCECLNSFFFGLTFTSKSRPTCICIPIIRAPSLAEPLHAKHGEPLPAGPESALACAASPDVPDRACRNMCLSGARG